MKGGRALCMDFSSLLAGTALLSHQPLDHPGPQGSNPFLLILYHQHQKFQKIKAANTQGWLEEPQIQGINSFG